MSDKLTRKILNLLFLVTLIALSAPAYPAENAVITGDSVRVRTQPSVREDVRGTLNKGARVQVISRTDFSDTIDGYAAPWYEIVYGEYGGFVFGRYVKLDPGVSVPPLGPGELYGDPVSRFIMHGLYNFGKSTPDVLKTLGQPISRVHEKAEGLIVGVDTLTYKGLVISTRGIESGKTFVFMVTCTTPAYAFDTLKVGSPISDVERVLGPPQQPYDPGDESVSYYNISGFDWVTFMLKNGTVTEISFYESMAD